mgnify:CR=1 FL=1
MVQARLTTESKMDSLKALQQDIFLKEIVNVLKSAQIVKFKQLDGGVYEYIMSPITDGNILSPRLLWGMGLALLRILNVEEADYILVPEAMGIHLGAVMSILSGKPLVIARKRRYGVKGEIEIVKKTAYGESKLYINGLNPGDRVVIADAIIATGGTLAAIIKTLLSKSIRIVDVGVLVEKEGLGGVERVLKETGYRVKSVLKVRIQDGEVIVNY